MAFGLIFTYLMSYGGAVVAVFNPFIGLLIYISFALLRPGPGLWYWSVPEGNYSKVLAIGLILGWLIRGTGDWRFGRASIPIIALLAYFGWSLLSLTQARVPEVAWEWIEGQFKIVLPVIVGITLIDSVAKLKALAWVILLSQGYVAYDLNMSYFAGFNRLHEIGFGGMDNNCNGIGMVTVLGLGIFLCLSTPQLWQKGVAAACVGFMVHAILFSFSRGAMLGFLIVVGVSFLLIPKRPIHYVALILGMGMTLSVTGDEVMKRFSSSFATEEERDSSANDRLNTWTAAIQMATRNPILGLGPHHFPVHASEFGLTANKEAHSTWLQLAAEIGIPGVSLLALFYLSTVLFLWPLTKESFHVSDPWLRDVARMVIAAIVGFLVTSQFVTLPGLEAPYYVTLLGAGSLKLLLLEDWQSQQDDLLNPTDRNVDEWI